MSSFSGNVLLTKIKAMYARSISRKSYFESITACTNTLELLKKLKENEFYTDILRDVPETEELIHRSDIEKLLTYKFLDTLNILNRYEKILGGCFTEYIACYMDSLFILEIFKKILKFIHNEKHIYSSFKRKIVCSSKKLLELSNAKSLDEFFSTLKKTSYAHLFKSIASLKDESYLQNFVQKKLYENLYQKLFLGINKIKDSKLRKSCYKIFKNYIELSNFVMTIRFKRFNNNTSGEILPRFKNSIKLELTNKLKKLNIESETFGALNNSSLHSSIKNIKYSYLEQLPEKYLYMKCKKNMSFSFEPSVAVVSFINLLKIEIRNLVKIIESVRCSLPQNKIKELLLV